MTVMCFEMPTCNNSNKYDGTSGDTYCYPCNSPIAYTGIWKKKEIYLVFSNRAKWKVDE